ncbi:MAG: HlyD family efflux transporter periplasmic adaptor subunit [Gammaproteobacteria bacterium]|nr:HlyD family efflux transporter periplasmic adaptor subunit [Gammaproteobacteria bacterium]
MAPRMQWLEAEEDGVEQVRERDIQIMTAGMRSPRLPPYANASRHSSQFEQQRLSELNEIENRIQSLRQELIKAEQRFTLQQLRAPVSGTVNQLIVTTIGGVVEPAQKLMTIVPDKDPAGSRGLD